MTRICPMCSERMIVHDETGVVQCPRCGYLSAIDLPLPPPPPPPIGSPYSERNINRVIESHERVAKALRDLRRDRP